MKIKDLAPLIGSEEIAIYKAVGEDMDAVSPDLYVGIADETPEELRRLSVVCMGVFDRGILEIQVRDKT